MDGWMCASVVKYTVGYLVIGKGRTRESAAAAAGSCWLVGSIDRVGPVPTHVGWQSREQVSIYFLKALSPYK